MVGGERHCGECGRTGKCAKCFGTGTNIALNSDQDKCPNCYGTGICPACSDDAENGGIITLGL
jgi:hypothetical protein